MYGVCHRISCNRAFACTTTGSTGSIVLCISPLTALMIALLKNCLAAKTSPAIFIRPHCLYSDVTATLNQLLVQEIPGQVETKPLYGSLTRPFPQRVDCVKGLARETSLSVPDDTSLHHCLQNHCQYFTILS